MLEIINLKKTYKTKQGVETHALNGVTLKFPETGLVFLLGKSGSGKSTLLNVCGGLDSATEGEIIIKGRSSKDFTQTDFDSYRNTFVGFIFQEYNILQEFTVEDNIALALELQGKSKDTEAINNLLTQVDLEGLGKRKPNTLSGGQKQRIAIARALIKNPEIIMADEPTGALDSATGKQVFDTLKKLSKDKLIIVVSHDRDFAEQYGDRIIELKDGKVISDISKTEEKQEKLNNNISIIGEEILCVSDGESLTEDDFKIIKKFLKSNTKAIICNDQKDVSAMKKAAKINEHGRKESFKETNSEAIKLKEYSKKDSEFIKSKLPLKHAVKIGASSLKVKPFKLFLTIVLCSFAFILFGLLSTMMLYNGEEVFKETISSSDLQLLKIDKVYKSEQTTYTANGEKFSYETFNNGRITEKEYNEFKQQYGNKTIGIVSYQYEISNVAQKLSSSSYYRTAVKGLSYLDKDNSLRDNITGTYPTKENEVVISSYLAESIVESSLNNPDNNKKYSLSSYEELINKKIVVNNTTYKITGILPVGLFNEEIESLKTNQEPDYQLVSDLEIALSENLHQILFVTKESLSNLPLSSEQVWNIFDNNGGVALKTNNEYPISFQYASINSGSSFFNIKYLDESNKTLDDNEIIISYGALSSVINEKILNAPESIQNKYHGIYGNDGINYKLYELMESNLDSNTRKSYETDIISFLKESKLTNITLYAYNSNDNLLIDSSSKKVNIIGIYNEKYYNTLFVSDNLNNEFNKVLKENYLDLGYTHYESKTNYVAPQNSIYDSVFIEFNHEEETINSLAQYANLNYDNDYNYKIGNSIVEEVSMVNDLVDSLSKVFLYVGLVVAAFAILLLSNFISTSISNKTKEIGILRAVGARSLDVFKIFLSETFIISVICIILSVVGGVVVCSILNNSLTSLTNVTLFVFGIPSILMLIIVAIITTIVATFLPVRKAANKKPVDSIRGA